MPVNSTGVMKSAFFRKEMTELENEASALRQEQFALNNRSNDEVNEFRRFVKEWGNGDQAMPVFPEEAFTNYVDRVIVNSQTSFTFCLKCGLKLTENH